VKVSFNGMTTECSSTYCEQAFKGPGVSTLARLICHRAPLESLACMPMQCFCTYSLPALIGGWPNGAPLKCPCPPCTQGPRDSNPKIILFPSSRLWAARRNRVYRRWTSSRRRVYIHWSVEDMMAGFGSRGSGWVFGGVPHP